jgi:hypothetical protein
MTTTTGGWGGGNNPTRPAYRKVAEPLGLGEHAQFHLAQREVQEDGELYLLPRQPGFKF